ncbi:MAG: hypothetical protein RL134_2523 [Actinomycetota bacterium]|jgi:hypothetical protein
MVDPAIAEQVPGLLATLRSTAIELHSQGLNALGDLLLDTATVLEVFIEELENLGAVNVEW